uniref:Uncharacterized protein n=1 Tax=Physcomitrium patens TaxID=3218 RepID=A0A2K1JUQ0_PHYPA|nr:hypothetical protein PHYPA_015019 [Physcomitrium patens]
MLGFVAVLIGVVVFEATMVMTTSLCSGDLLSTKRTPKHSQGVMWSGARGGGHTSSVVRVKNLTQ